MDLNLLNDDYDDREENDLLLELAKINREAMAKGKTTEVRSDLEKKMMRFDKINAAKAVNKHGLMNRLHIDEKKHSKLSSYL